jgi:hypothetical protein
MFSDSGLSLAVDIGEAEMNKSFSTFVAVSLSTLLVSGCDLIGDIFEAGVWIGVLGVIALIVLVVWVFGKVVS